MGGKKGASTKRRIGSIAGSVALNFKKRVYTQLNFNTYAVRIFPASA